MNTNVMNEQQLQKDINSLKSQYPETKELYREACVLLFFRYGITPTANRLYQYVRKGSMSAPAEALNQFWAEIRDKSHIRIERADIPESLLSASGELISKLWSTAQNDAQENYSELIENATSEIIKFKIEAEASNQKSNNLDVQLKNTEVELKNALNKASEIDYLLQVNINTLTQRENQLRELKIEKDELTTSIKLLKESFSKDIDAIGASLNKAELRYNDLERKSLLEMDHLRQQVKQLEKDVRQARNDSTNKITKFNVEVTALKCKLSAQCQKNLSLTEMLSEYKRTLKSTEKKLSTVTIKYEFYKSKDK